MPGQSPFGGTGRFSVPDWDTKVAPVLRGLAVAAAGAAVTWWASDYVPTIAKDSTWAIVATAISGVAVNILRKWATDTTK